MSKRILIMGLPGAGKTALADELNELFLSLGLRTLWLNENRLREEFPDLTPEQVHVLANDNDRLNPDYIIADLVAPTSPMRRSFNPHYTVWVNTIPEEEYQFSNYGFEPPFKYNMCVTTRDASKWAREIFHHIMFLKTVQ